MSDDRDTYSTAGLPQAALGVGVVILLAILPR